MTPADVSVIIPTWNEESAITRAIRSALDADAGEIIVCDGGSSDGTLEAASQAGATKVIQCSAGRGTQLSAGANSASRKIVLFLHADARLGKESLQQICDLGEDLKWGAFQQSIQHTSVLYRLVEFGNSLRVKWRRMPFGDQGIFVRRDLLMEAGGVAEIPLMEDVDLSRRLGKIAKPVLLPGPIEVDSRRWQKRGLVRQTLRNWSIQFAYKLGVSPERLKTW